MWHVPSWSSMVEARYSSVKGKATDATTLVAQTSTLLRRQRENKLGQRRELSDVLALLESKEWMGGEEMTVQVLVDQVENLPKNQAKRTPALQVRRDRSLSL